MQERLSVIQALIKESVANNQFACSGCGSPNYNRVVVYEPTADKVGQAASIITKCNSCIEKDGSISGNRGNTIN